MQSPLHGTEDPSADSRKHGTLFLQVTWKRDVGTPTGEVVSSASVLESPTFLKKRDLFNGRI